MIEVSGAKLSLVSMGIFTTEHKWEKSKNSIDTYEILYVVRGRVTVEDGARRSFESGNMVILKPTSSQRVCSCIPNSVFYYIHIKTDNLDVLTGGTLYFKEIENNYLFKELALHYRMSKNDFSLPEVMLAEILLRNKSVIKERGTRKLVTDLYDTIRLNASPKLRIEDVASLYGYNQEHLTRLVKKEYGKGIKELINGFVVEKCKNSLSNTNLSIKEISAQLKFDDSQSFVKFFKYHTGTTPSRYRDKLSSSQYSEKEF